MSLPEPKTAQFDCHEAAYRPITGRRAAGVFTVRACIGVPYAVGSGSRDGRTFWPVAPLHI
jgi:hypothetical protein